jgi:hypothetical protein
MLRRVNQKGIIHPRRGGKWINEVQLKEYFKVNKIKMISREEKYREHYKKIKKDFDKIVIVGQYTNPFIEKKTGKRVYVEKLELTIRGTHRELITELNDRGVPFIGDDIWNFRNFNEFINLLKYDQIKKR